MEPKTRGSGSERNIWRCAVEDVEVVGNVDEEEEKGCRGEGGWRGGGEGKDV